MTRKEELMKVFDGVDTDKRVIIVPVIDEIVFIEGQMTELKKYPFIKIHPNDPSKQKQTVAGKQYKDLVQQHSNLTKILLSVLNKDDGGEDSPLREYLKKLEELG